MDDSEEDLTHRLLRLIYEDLVADARGHHRYQVPQRFMSPAGLARARSRVLDACRQHAAGTEFVQFVEERWLPQFRPLLS